MSEEYDLRKSSEKVGQLYPVILSKDGQVIDGFHRLNAVSKWRTEVRDDVDTHEKLIKARLISNKFRRQVTAIEVEGWINELGEIALIEHSIKPGQISGHIANETGYDINTVLKYLEQKYKNPKIVESGKIARETQLESSSQRGREIVSEAARALGKDKFEQLKAIQKEEIKTELKQDPEFIIEAIEKAPEVLSAQPVPVIDIDGYHKPTVEKIVHEEAREKSREVENELEIFRETSELRDKSRLMKAWRALGVILTTSKDLVCPICDSEAMAILKCSQCGEVPLAEAERIAKDAIQ